ncbi:MAG TPA: DNA-binding protein WhiA [Lachnospiraceae bacterium]|nr:DNA-binding protein WhiA [Lachnospiraceae bacterium]
MIDQTGKAEPVSLSFSARVKGQIEENLPKAKHCRMAMLGAILSSVGEFGMDPYKIEVFSENSSLIHVTAELLESVFNIKPVTALDAVILDDSTQAKSVLRDLGFLTGSRQDKVLDPFMPDLMLKKPCCRRAYISGAFLASGSINDPTKNYHIEFLQEEERGAIRLQQFLKDYGIESRILERTRPSRKKGEKTVFVLYLKDGEQIVDVLAVMKANQALMELENVRIVKDVRNKVNRQVNCETANLNRVVSSSVRQVNDIRYLASKGVLTRLSPELKQMAEVRLSHENMALKDLGVLMDPPVSKSGVYHRLKKLSEIAENLRLEGKVKEDG